MKVKAEIKIIVWYEDVNSLDEAEKLISKQVSNSVASGMLTPDDITVDTWTHSITVERLK